MIALLDLQDQLKVDSEDMDLLMDNLDIEPFNDLVTGYEARLIADSFLHGGLDRLCRGTQAF